MEEIKSTLVNHKSMRNVKDSLIAVSQIDGKEKFRVKMLEYINDSSYNSDDKYFYDMLPFVRFLTPDEEETAFTDPYKQIYLNAPSGGKDEKGQEMVGENVRQWDFIYDHECLHQLWDTFGVGDKIKAAGEEYNHGILNIASDCVINDYLTYYRKKEAPSFGVTPESIKAACGVEYDRTKDTQYTLYFKLMKVKDKLIPLLKKIKPHKVNKVPPPPTPPKSPDDDDELIYPDDFVKGYKDAIRDVQTGKVDPTDPSYKPKDTGNPLYDLGYDTAMASIKEGMENGINVSDGPMEGGQKTNLPQIPWDVPKDKDKKDDKQKKGGSSGGSGDSDDSDSDQSPEDSAQQSADDAQQSADAAKQAADEAAKNGDPDANKKADAANKAQSAADKAKQAADAAKKAAKSGDSAAAKKAADDAAKAADDAAKNAKDAGAGDTSKDHADNARKSASAAQKNADKAKGAAQGGDEKAKKAAQKAQEAADRAMKEAAKAQQAEARGDKEAAKEAARKAQEAADEAAVAAQEAGVDKGNVSTNKGPSKGQGHGPSNDIPVFTEADLEEIKRQAEKVIKKYSNKLSGKFGEFISKTKSSARLDKSSLNVRVKKGSNGWDMKMQKIVDAYFTQKVWQLQQMKKRTYTRPHRRDDYIKPGMPINPGSKKIEEAMPLTIAFYIDRSGSMGSSLDNAFKACYILCEAMKKRFSHYKVVESLGFKIFAFDTRITPIKFGNTCSCGGCTFDMDQLCGEIEKHTKDFLVNIVITDGQFNVNKTEVKKFVERLEGIAIFIINSKQRDVEQVAKMIPNQLYYLEADSNFLLDDDN